MCVQETGHVCAKTQWVNGWYYEESYTVLKPKAQKCMCACTCKLPHYAGFRVQGSISRLTDVAKPFGSAQQGREKLPGARLRRNQLAYCYLLVGLRVYHQQYNFWNHYWSTAIERKGMFTLYDWWLLSPPLHQVWMGEIRNKTHRPYFCVNLCKVISYQEYVHYVRCCAQFSIYRPALSLWTIILCQIQRHF